MIDPTTRSNRPGNPTTHPAETSRAPERSSPAPAFLVALLALAAMGCVPVKDYCRTAVSATVRAVDVSMKVAGDLHTAGRITDDTAWQLVAAHDVYRPIAKAAKAGCDTVGSHEDADKELARLQAAADDLLRQAVEAGR
jgi:hypothetical protein